MTTIKTAAACGVTALALPVDTYADRLAIDSQRSVMTIHVYKAGLFSVFAHDHQITTPIARGHIQDSENPLVEFWVNAGMLRVVDSDLPAKHPAEVQRTMEGPDVLDIRRFPEIRFRSTDARKAGVNRWTVHGDLDLHGQNHPLAIELSEKEDLTWAL